MRLFGLALVLFFVNACGADYPGDSQLQQESRDSIRWKSVFMTGDDSISAFDNARKKIASLFETRGVDHENTRHLSMARNQQNSEVSASSASNFRAAWDDLDIQDGDGCALFMTSHGTRSGFYMRGQSYLTPSQLDDLISQHCGQRPTVLLISACYSGVFAESSMQAPNRIILTAARKDRTSFGCSSEAVYTYWDGCIATNFDNSATWAELYNNVTSCIERKERAGGFTPSFPQARFGDGMEDMAIFDSAI